VSFLRSVNHCMNQAMLIRSAPPRLIKLLVLATSDASPYANTSPQSFAGMDDGKIITRLFNIFKPPVPAVDIFIPSA